jgi:aminodeoxyfutalosine synthase
LIRELKMTETFEALMGHVEAGERLSSAQVTALAQSPDILQLGMLADAVRRRLRGTTVTYARVARCAFDQPFTDAVLPSATEVRITGDPATLDVAVAAVRSARAVAGDRLVSGFAWPLVEQLASEGGSASEVLRRLRDAGLDAIEAPLDRLANPAEAIDRLVAAGFQQLRLTIDKAPAAERLPLLLLAAELQERFACIQVLNPLPMVLNALRPTTGYDDAKSVALARLAAPNIPVIQVDWLRYGPKLAQVALTFGADDLDEVSASDEAPEGRRRAPIEEVRRNIEAAGFVAAERDGRFALK